MAKKKNILTIIIFVYITVLFSSCVSQKEPSQHEFILYSEFRENQESFLSSDGQMKYIDQGQGPVILLLHGVPTSSWLYRKMIDGLVTQGYRVIVPDMLGYGYSSNPQGYEIYSAKEHGKRILELMDSLDIEQWTHVMHDAGGLWTWEMLSMSQNRVSELIILNSIIYSEGFFPPIKMDAGSFSKFIMWLYSNNMTTDMLLDMLFTKGLSENNLKEYEIEGYKTPLIEGKTRAMYYFFTQTCNGLRDYSSIIEKILVPVCLIWGENDDMLRWDPQANKVIKSLNLQSDNIHLLDAKHFIQEEKPLEIIRIIVNFIKD